MISPPPLKWLPEDALRSRRARDAVDECVAQWSDEWIARGTIKVADSWSDAARSVGFLEVEKKNGIGVKYRPDPDYRLAAMLLARKIGPKDIRTEMDSQLVNRLTDQALSDLLRRLNTAFPAASSDKAAADNYENPIELALTVNQEAELVIVSIDREILIDHALKNSRAPRQFPASATREEALAKQRIVLSALVGKTRLELAELVEIGVGDVLVLDRPSAMPLDLMINNRIQGSESASLSLDNDRLTLSIERTADQW